MSLSLAKAQARVQKAAVSKEAAELMNLDMDQLLEKLRENTRYYCAAYKKVGRIIYFIRRKLIESGEYRPNHRRGNRQCMGVSSILIANGFDKMDFSNGYLAATAYARVMDGRISEEAYMGLSALQCRDLHREDAGYTPRPKTSAHYAAARAAPEDVVAQEADDIPENLDEERGIQQFEQALKLAQQWLIRARDVMPEHSPGQWNELLTQALSPVGRIRFSIQEMREQEARKPKSLLDLPSLTE